jgi:hypothetical protein
MGQDACNTLTNPIFHSACSGRQNSSCSATFNASHLVDGGRLLGMLADVGVAAPVSLLVSVGAVLGAYESAIRRDLDVRRRRTASAK